MTESELCRLCAESKPDVIGIYGSEGQKLNIEAKVARYLHIEITSVDGLPHCVCIDCCVLLNQCSEFYEQTNAAQKSLRHLYLESKPVDSMPSEFIDTNNKTANLKEENHELSDHNYVSEALNDASDSADEHNSDLPDKCTDDADKKRVKKTLRKKKVKRMTLTKSNIKIPDNYMTGTDSDKELIDARAAEAKNGTKKDDTMDRYPWLCTDCNDKLPSLEMLKKHHQTVHNQQAKYMCVQCCKVYDKYYGFLTHVKRHKKTSKYTCDECGKSFVHKKVLDSHRAIHSEERPHICPTCGKAFRQQSALYIHSRCHLPETMKNRFPCDQCDKRFSTKPNLVTHKRIHSGVRNFTCDQCGKSFIQKGNLEAHFLTHSADKPYTCSQCPKAFKTPLQLKKHETVHTGAKPHQCAVCGRTFREKGTLREHHRIHTGAMPFTCEFCGKCFRFKGILTTHRRQHTGERPYSCLECQHHFTNWPNYNKHMKRRHGINTSHMKHLQPLPQQPQVQAQQTVLEQQQQQQQSLSVVTNVTEDMRLSQNVTPSIVQVIQTIPQPIVVQAIPTSAIQTFQTDVVSTSPQETVFRERNGGTYFNTVPGTIQNFLPPHLPYNFYNISNVTENESILPR